MLKVIPEPCLLVWFEETQVHSAPLFLGSVPIGTDIYAVDVSNFALDSGLIFLGCAQHFQLAVLRGKPGNKSEELLNSNQYHRLKFRRFDPRKPT